MKYERLKIKKITDSPIFRVKALLSLMTRDYAVKIIDVLEKHDEGLCVTDVYIAVRMEQSVCSFFLREMAKYNIVSSERRGKEIVYSLKKATLSAIRGNIEELNFLITKEK